MHDYVPIFLKYSGGGPPDSPFFYLYLLSKSELSKMSPGECFGIIIAPNNFE